MGGMEVSGANMRVGDNGGNIGSGVLDLSHHLDHNLANHLDHDLTHHLNHDLGDQLSLSLYLEWAAYELEWMTPEV